MKAIQWCVSVCTVMIKVFQNIKRVKFFFFLVYYLVSESQTFWWVKVKLSCSNINCMNKDRKMYHRPRQPLSSIDQSQTHSIFSSPLKRTLTRSLLLIGLPLLLVKLPLSSSCFSEKRKKKSLATFLNQTVLSSGETSDISGLLNQGQVRSMNESKTWH